MFSMHIALIKNRWILNVLDSEQKWYKVISRNDDLRGPSASPQQEKDPPISAGEHNDTHLYLGKKLMFNRENMQSQAICSQNKKPTPIPHKNKLMNITVSINESNSQGWSTILFPTT
jgi:hypothetical protein